MNDFEEYRDSEFDISVESRERLGQLERELVEETNRPAVAAIVMAFLLLGLLLIGVFTYSCIGGSRSAAVFHYEDVSRYSLVEAEREAVLLDPA